MDNVRVAKSYVWHGDQCFFVSTIDRDSSSMMGGRYAETFVWEYDWDKADRGKMVGQADGLAGSVATHFRVCRALRDHGALNDEKEG